MHIVCILNILSLSGIKYYLDLHQVVTFYLIFIFGCQCFVCNKQVKVTFLVFIYKIYIIFTMSKTKNPKEHCLISKHSGN